MDNGWIKIHRSILEWEWWDDCSTFRMFSYCLLRANHEDKKWHGTTIERGSFITTQNELSRATGLTRQQVRKSLVNLISTNEITSKATNKNTIITICNYDKYQVSDNGEQPTKQPTNNQQPTNEQEKEKKNPPITPYKENKKNIDINVDEQENIGLTIVRPSAAFAPSDKKKSKKYSNEEVRLHGELRDIYCEEWTKTHGEEFYWGPAAMTATIKIADQIKFYMPLEQKNDTEQLKYNFRFFIQKTLNSSDTWLRTNATPQVVASKFNEIYTFLKNGKPRQQQQNGPSDEFLQRVAAEVAANGGLAF